MQKKSWVSAKQNQDFILIETCSGYNRFAKDPKGASHHLSCNTDNESLGRAVIDALSHSRFLTLKEVEEFFDYERIQKNYENWRQNLMTRYGYKTKKALFKNMMSVSIEVYEGQMTLMPWSQEKLEAWGPTPNGDADNVIIPADSSSEDIGAALRLAFSRCTER